MQRKESVEEFLARGGQIQRVEYDEPEEAAHVVKASNAGPPTLYSLDEAEHLFTESRSRRRKPKQIKTSDIDKSLLPENLQNILEELDVQQEK